MTKITISEKRRETVKKEFFGFYAIKYAEASKKGLVYTKTTNLNNSRST
jgi:hypothetical protein